MKDELDGKTIRILFWLGTKKSINFYRNIFSYLIAGDSEQKAQKCVS